MTEHPSIAEKLLRTRWLMRAPIGIYRAGWGWIFGRRLVMIEHLGRQSNEPRYVVVEVVHRGSNSLQVASGFGVKAQWYRNIAANGVAYLSTGTTRRTAVAVRLLDSEQSLQVLDGYSRRHPLVWKILGPVMTRLSGDQVTPIVEFGPIPQSSTAPTS